MRAYLRLDPTLLDHKKDYSDHQLAAYIALLCAAEQQPARGRFKSLPILRAYLGRLSRHVPFLISHKDLLQFDDGSFYVDGWDEWQEGDWKVAERVRRIRSRPHLASSVTADVTVPVTVDVTVTAVNTPPNPARQIANSGKQIANSNGGEPLHTAVKQPQTDETIATSLARIQAKVHHS